jgi:ribosomal protein S19
MENRYPSKVISYECLKKSLVSLVELKLFGVLKVCFKKNSFINKFLIGQYIFVYKGNFFINFIINLFMVGSRLGGFIVTKKFNLHNSFKKIRLSKR